MICVGGISLLSRLHEIDQFMGMQCVQKSKIHLLALLLHGAQCNISSHNDVIGMCPATPSNTI